MSSLHKSAVLALLALALSRTAPAAVVAGDPFPALASAGLTGAALPDLHGKILLVDFWASWCAPCKASFAALDRLQSEFGPRGLMIVAVSVDEKPAAFTAFVQKWHPAFPAVLDREQKLVNAVSVPAMPTSYLIGPDGRVRFVHQGFHGRATESEWREHITALLNGKA